MEDSQETGNPYDSQENPSFPVDSLWLLGGQQAKEI